MITDGKIRWLYDEAHQRWEIAREAERLANHASARALLANMAQVAERHPGLKSFSFDVQFEYDDEGGYYPNCNINADVDWDFPGQQEAGEKYGDPDDEDDICYGQTREIAIIAFESDSEWQGSMTRAEVLERAAKHL